MPYAPQGVKGTDDDGDDIWQVKYCELVPTQTVKSYMGNEFGALKTLCDITSEFSDQHFEY